MTTSISRLFCAFAGLMNCGEVAASRRENLWETEEGRERILGKKNLEFAMRDSRGSGRREGPRRDVVEIAINNVLGERYITRGFL